MKKRLFDVYEKINCDDYSLREYAKYFEKFHGYILIIETNNFVIKTKIEKNALPHILGLHYAYANKKDSKDYKGKNGFDKLINGKISLEELKMNIKNSSTSKVGWKMIQRRIEFLPMFLNTIQRKTRMKVIMADKISRKSLIQGKYALFKTAYEKNKMIFPMLTLKELSNSKIIIETFIVEDNITFLGALNEINIENIELISPIYSTHLYTIIKEKTNNH